MTEPGGPHLSRRGLLRVAGLSLGGLALAACAGPGDSSSTSPSTGSPSTDPALESLVAAARQEGAVDVWGILTPVHLASVAAAFEATYPGIKATLTTYSPSDVVTRVDAEQSSGIGSQDVLLQSDRIWHAKHPEYWATVTGPAVLAADELARKGAAPRTGNEPVPSQVLYDGNTRVITLFGPYGYVWRKDAVGSDPSFEDLFSGDTFKEALGVLDPNASPPAAALLYHLRKRYPDLFARLGELKPTLYPLAGPAAQALGAGAVDAVLGISRASVSAVQNVGFGFDTRFPALASPVYGEILKSSKRPNAAQLFMNWLMTPDGQKAWCSGYASVLPNIPTAVLSAADVEVNDGDAIDPAELKRTISDFNSALGR